MIPANLRRAMDIRPKETLVVRVSGERLMLEKPEQILERLKNTFSNVPAEVSLADELIAERRGQASSEV